MLDFFPSGFPGKPCHFLLRMGWRMGHGQEKGKEQENATAAEQHFRGKVVSAWPRNKMYIFASLSGFPTQRERKPKAHADLARSLNVSQRLIYYKETTMRTDGEHKADAELKSKQRWTILQLTISKRGGSADAVGKKSLTRETSDWAKSGSQEGTPQGCPPAMWNDIPSGFPGLQNGHTGSSQMGSSKKSEVVKATKYQKTYYTRKAFWTRAWLLHFLSWKQALPYF